MLSYPLTAFKQAPEVGVTAAGSSFTPSLGLVVTIEELEKRGVSDLARVVIVRGYDPDNPDRWPSRSEALHFVNCELARVGISKEVACAVIRNRDFKISESVNDKPNPDKYAVRQIDRAYEKAATDNATTAAPNPEPTADDPKPLKLVSLAPVPDDLPRRKWVIEGLLMDGQTTLIAGRGGASKSLGALQLGIAVATGGKFAWWHATRRENVLIVNAEDDLHEMQRRLMSACEVMGVDPQALSDRVFTLSTERLVLVYRDPQDGKVRTSELYKQLARAISENDIGLLVIDPLVEAHAYLDENSNVDMKEVIVRLRQLARMCDIPVLIVHHGRKGSTSGDQDSARGGSSIVNACRIVHTFEPMSIDEAKRIFGDSAKVEERWRYVRIAGAKANYSGRGSDHWMELISVDLPNGDRSPGLRECVFGELGDGFDVETWPHRAAFLQLVTEGNGQRPWSTATRGSSEVRLDAHVRGRFSLDSAQARAAIEAFEHAGRIERTQWSDAKGHPGEVWQVSNRPPVPQQDDDELPF